MSDTPRTDLMTCVQSGDVVPAEFSRQLERELEEAENLLFDAEPLAGLTEQEKAEWLSKARKVLKINAAPEASFAATPEYADAARRARRGEPEPWK